MSLPPISIVYRPSEGATPPNCCEKRVHLRRQVDVQAVFVTSRGSDCVVRRSIRRRSEGRPDTAGKAPGSCKLLDPCGTIREVMPAAGVRCARNEQRIQADSRAACSFLLSGRRRCRNQTGWFRKPRCSRRAPCAAGPKWLLSRGRPRLRANNCRLRNSHDVLLITRSAQLRS